MASTSSEAGMKKESSASGSGEGTEEAPARVRSESLYVGGLKKARRERLLGCTTAKERISKMPPCVAGKRSSIYRGVTRHRWTGRYEAHLWDKSTWNQNQNKKGKQVYLGAYDDDEAAARAYDLAALKYWGPGTLINFPVSDYSRDLEEMQVVSKEDYLVSLRRKSSAFSRGSPKCRGVTRFPQSGQLEASLGQVLGSDYCTSLNCSMAMDSSMEKKYVNNICMDRKIDLTSYIRWWGPNRKHQSDSFGKSVDENPTTSEEASKELHELDYQQQPTEPYQLPVLGPPRNVKSNAPSVSAYAIISQSIAFKNFKQRLSESSNDSCSKELSYERSAPVMSTGSEIERTCASLGFHDLPNQITAPTRMPLVSMPSKSNWSSVDTNTDVIFWANQALPSGLPTAPTLKKFETSSPYP